MREISEMISRSDRKYIEYRPRYDNRRKIPMSDALYTIDEALRRTNDPYLNIAKLDLRYKTVRSILKTK